MRRIAFLTSVLALVLSCPPRTATAQDGGRAEAAKLQSARELYAAGNWETAKEAYAEVYEKAPDSSPLKAEAALEWGSILWEQGYYADAEKRVEDSLERARALDLDHALGRLMLTLGHIEASRGKFSDAESTLKVCASMAAKQRDANYAALCRMNLRFVRQLQAKSVGPESQYRRDLATLEASGSPLLIGTALAKSAELREKAGAHGEALELLKRAHAQFEKASSLPATARNRIRLARLYQDTGQWQKATEMLDGLLLTFRNMGNRPAVITTHVLLGKQAAHADNAQEAMKYHQKAVSLASKLGSPHIHANARLAMCDFLSNTNADKSLVDHCSIASRLFSKAGVPELAARAEIILARHAQASGDLKTARQRYLKVISMLEEQVADNREYRRNIATQRVNLCQVEMKLKANGAHQRCRDALKALQAVGAKDAEFREMLAGTHYALGATAARADESEEAVKHLEKAADLFAELGNFQRAADATLRLGGVQLDRKKSRKEAASTFRRGLQYAEKSTNSDPATRIQLRIQLGQLLVEKEQWKEAEQVLETLVQTAEGASDSYSQAWGLSALARVKLKRGDRSAAIDALKKALPIARKAKDDELASMIAKNLEKMGDE